MKTVTALEARKTFGGILDGVAEKGEHVLIARMNKPMAVLVPYADYQQGFDALARQKRLSQMVEAMDRLRGQHRKKAKGLNPVKIIRALRDTR